MNAALSHADRATASSTSSPPATQYSIAVALTLDNVPGVLGRLAMSIGDAGGNIFAVEGFVAKGPIVERSIVVNCCSVEHQLEIVDIIANTEGVTLNGWYDRTFRLHEGGKIEISTLCSVGDIEDLSMAYTPGVARICRAIEADPVKADDYTVRKNTVAIVTDGSAVLGLGNIGPKAALPVMEGKALLFKEFGGVDAFPICLDARNADEIIAAVEAIAPTFGGINLEDIAAPNAFEVEEALKARLDIPVFHDDQHGTAIVVLAALENSLRITGKRIEDLSVVITGVGAAGVAIGKMLLSAGVGHLVGVDIDGVLYDGRQEFDQWRQWFVEHTNRGGHRGRLGDVIGGADVFIGVSGPNVLSVDDIKRMAPDPVVFALANPDPEIAPELAAPLVRVLGTGRSDYPNQINNVLAFPGVFRGALDARATEITEGMKLAAAGAIAATVSDAELSETRIIPSVFERATATRVAEAVHRAAIVDGVSRV